MAGRFLEFTFTHESRLSNSKPHSVAFSVVSSRGFDDLPRFILQFDHLPHHVSLTCGDNRAHNQISMKKCGK